MASRQDSDVDDDFSDLYKEYTGPLRSNPTAVTDTAATVKKRSLAGSDEEDEARDPNAVPTDFTSREAKVWEAKSKAIERNWKKRKEEEMICKICGESGHFTQGCPSTLGANRKSQDFFERVPARDKNMRALFTERVISKIEKDIGCKIKMDEKFIIVSAKDGSIMSKGVDAVHKIREEGNKNTTRRSRSPGRRSPVSSRPRSPQNSSSHFPRSFGRQEKVVEERVREEWRKVSRGSPRAYSGNEGGGRSGRSSHSKSPAAPTYYNNNNNNSSVSYNNSTYDGHSQSKGVYRTDGWDGERRGNDILPPEHKLEYPLLPKTLEEIELEYKREAMDLGRIRDKEEDEENYRHREAVREMREGYMKKLAILRGKQAKQWEQFVQMSAFNQQQPPPGYDTPAPPPPNYGGGGGGSSGGGGGMNLAMESRGRYSNSMESYPSSRPQESYGDFQRQRQEDYGKTYNRY
jgi:hypothetical protein